MKDLQIRIGRRIRNARKKSELTLDELARRSGVARTTISKVERNLISPSINTLIRISSGLNKSLGYFISENGLEDIALVRKEDRSCVEFTRSHLMVMSLTRRLNNMQIEVKEAIVERGGGSLGEHPPHYGEEFILCLKGSLEFRIDGKIYHLRKGDSLHFRSVYRHAWRNIGAGEARALWVHTPPLFSPEEARK
jgi:transcriptional regulator with XRE-family HTH domain